MATQSSRNENFKRLRAECLKAGKLYEDQAFPAENKSIYFDKEDPSIIWRRPSEICSNPQFLVDGASKRDLCQGKIGDCWFLAATAILSTKPKLFRQVVPLIQDFVTNYAGVFHFNFWQYGEWVDVVIDDRLPTRDGHLIFCHNRESPNEFWSSLLEKAYAKLNGSYQALEAGYSSDALVDFTGGIAEFMDLKDIKNKEKLFKTMKRIFNKNSFLCCALEVQDGKYEHKLDNGLVTGHAYSITHVLEASIGSDNVRLIRLRNPWGHREWNGPWSDGSPEWIKMSETDRNALDLKIDDDGEFWISFDDWLSNFHTLQICHLTPDTIAIGPGKHDWFVAAYHCAWIRGVTAGGSGAPPHEASTWDNPQFLVELKEPDKGREKSCLIVSLMQKYTRYKKSSTKCADTELPIGFDIYKYCGHDPIDVKKTQHLDHSSLHIVQKMYRYEFFRERTGRFNLEPGVYCVVPATFQVNQEGEFLLRVATERPVNVGEVEDQIQILDEPPPKEMKERKFDQLFTECAGDDSVIDAKELRCLLNKGLKREVDEGYSLATTRALIQAVTGDKQSLLKKNDCRKIWRKVKLYQETFASFDKDTSGKLDCAELEKAMTAIGVKMGKKALANVVKKFCSKTDLLTMDEFTLVAAKVAFTNGVFRKVKPADGDGSTNEGPATVTLTKQQLLDLML